MKGIKGVTDPYSISQDEDISMVGDLNIIGYSFYIPKSSTNGANVSINGGPPFPVDPGDSFPYGGMGTIAGCALVFQDIISVKFTSADPGNKFCLTRIRVPQITEVT